MVYDKEKIMVSFVESFCDFSDVSAKIFMMAAISSRLSLAVNKIDLENRTYTGGVKTSNGINRTVPIHPKVLPIIQKYYHEAIDIGRPMLFGRTQKFHGSFRYIENSFINSLLKKEFELGILGHVLHDGRHTFSTFAKAIASLLIYSPCLDCCKVILNTC